MAISRATPRMVDALLEKCIGGSAFGRVGVIGGYPPMKERDSASHVWKAWLHPDARSGFRLVLQTPSRGEHSFELSI